MGFLLEWDGQENGAFWVSGDTVYFDGLEEVAERFDVGTDASRGVILEFLDRPFSFAEPALQFQEIALHLQILLRHDAAAQQQTGNQDSQATNLQHLHAPDRRDKRR